MERSKFTLATCASIPILLAACSGVAAERAPGLESPTSESSGGIMEETGGFPNPLAAEAESSPTPPATGPSPARYIDSEDVVAAPKDILRSPAELAMLMGHVRAQIVYKTRDIPESDYTARIRPSLVYQLRLAGFEEWDIGDILADVDYSRRIQNLR